MGEGEELWLGLQSSWQTQSHPSHQHWVCLTSGGNHQSCCPLTRMHLLGLKALKHDKYNTWVSTEIGCSTLKSKQNLWWKKINWTEKKQHLCSKTSAKSSKHPQMGWCTSGSVDGAPGLAATTRRWIPRCFGLLIQTGLISIWITAVFITIVSLPTLCSRTFLDLYMDKTCITMEFPHTHTAYIIKK